VGWLYEGCRITDRSVLLPVTRNETSRRCSKKSSVESSELRIMRNVAAEEIGPWPSRFRWPWH
jgi:hypothetical protein